MKKWMALASLSLLLSCQQLHTPETPPWPTRKSASWQHNATDACVADYDPARDYFPDKAQLSWSTQLQVEYGRHWKRLRFTPGVNTGETLDFVLVQCGTPIPEDVGNAVVIEIPVRRLATAHPSMLGAIERIGMADRLVGVPNLESLITPELKARAQEGAIKVIYGYGHVTIEPVLALSPQVYLSFYSAYPDANLHRTLWALGVKALPWADHMESHPLGRAEWMLWLALLFNAEAQASRAFDALEDRYLALAELTRHLPRRPGVMGGTPSSRNHWEVTGRDNFRTQQIFDAGGRNVLMEKPGSGSLEFLSLERLLVEAWQAEIWLGGLSLAQGGLPASLPAQVYRLPAVQNGQVWAFDKDATGPWISPYATQSMDRPHEVLEDI